MFFSFSKEKIFLSQHLFLMIKAGMPISEALETLIEETKSRGFRKALQDILKQVLAGESLSKSFSRYPKIFDRFWQSIIKVGEESGNLEGNLKYLASQLRYEYETKRKVGGVLIYPAIIILMAFSISFFVTFFILPKLTSLLQILEIELPLPTRILIYSTSFLQKNWIFLIIGILSLIFIYKILSRLVFFKFYFDKISLWLPFFGQIQKNLALARFSQSFYTLLKSGVPILESLEICSQYLPNEVFKKALILVKGDVERGEKINQGFKKMPKIFPLIFSQMIAVGERTGTLEESCLYLAKFYQEEVESDIKNFSTLLEPLLLIFVGIFVGFIALAIITPIYQFTGSFKFR